MISTIAFYIGVGIFLIIGLLFVIGLIIAVIALIDFLRVYVKMNRGEEIGESQDLKQITKSLEEKEHKLIKDPIYEKPCKDSTVLWGFFKKLHNIFVFSLWVIMYAIWFSLLCIIGFISKMIELISACFKQNKQYD